MKRLTGMKRFSARSVACLVMFALLLLAAGCASISENTRAYLGSPQYAPTEPASVKILPEEPKQQKERLGEIVLSVDGKPSREQVEAKLRTAAAKLGADAVFIVYDKMHIFPMVYYDWWWGPMGTWEEMQRRIIGVAIKYK